METTEFKTITRQEYTDIKKEISKRFKFSSIKRHNQNYAMGGFTLSPKDWENGFTEKQIDSLCVFLKGLKIDTENLSVKSEEFYGDEHGKFAGTKIKYLTLKDGFNFLMRLSK